MKIFLAMLLLSLSLMAPFSAFAFLGMNVGATLQGPLPVWTKQFGSRLSPASTSGLSVATDPSKNVIVAGQTAGDFDGNTLIGTPDLYVTKYDASGTKLWSRELGVATSTVYVAAVATDLSGNIFVTGYTGGGLDGNTRIGTVDFFVTKYDSAGTKQWTRQLGVVSTFTEGTGVATDSFGNVFVTGTTSGGLDGNTRTGSIDLFITKYDSTGTKQWTKQLGVAAKATDPRAAAIDSSGNIFVAGYTNGGLDGNTLTGVQDFFVTKYDSTGTKLWTRQLGVASQMTYGNAAATDTSGSVFVTGYTGGGLDGNTLTGLTDFFVTKYDSTGAKQWTRQLGAASASTFGNGVATDATGNIFVAGYTSGGLDGNTLTGTQDFFVTKYDSTGAKQWTKQLGAPSSHIYGYAVATDSSGSILIAGTTDTGFDGNTLTGTQDFFVTKFDSTGTKLWTQQLGCLGPSGITAHGATVDNSGYLYIAGTATGSLDGNTLTGMQDFFVTKYDSTGAKLWTRQLGVASKNTNASAVATDTSGNVFVAGATTGGLDGNTLTGTQDFIVTKYNSAGTKQWTRQLGVASFGTYAYGVAVDSAGNIFVAGVTGGGLDGNTLSGVSDFFVTKYDSTGAKQWTRQMGVASKTTNANSVTTDSSGNIFLAGITAGGLDGNTLTGTQDFFVTKYDSTGAKQWTRQLGVASKATSANSVTTDSSGNIFVTGYTGGGLDGNTVTGTNDLFITKYDTTGTRLWTQQMGVATKITQCNAVITDSLGNVIVAGSTTGGLDGNALAGLKDFFITKYTGAGVKQWTKQLGVSQGTTSATGIALHSSGRLYVTGTGTSGIDFNSQSGLTDTFVSQYIGN